MKVIGWGGQRNIRSKVYMFLRVLLKACFGGRKVTNIRYDTRRK